MAEPRRGISPATAFFALLSVVLGVALYLEKRSPETTPSESSAASKRVAPRRAEPAPAPTRAAAAKAKPSPRAPGPDAGRIAIVIDDLGNDRAALERIARWPWPVAGAVLPGLPGSTDAARELARSGKEVLLHLPMEPDGYPAVQPGPGVILRSDSDEEIASTVAADLEWVPGAVGVNNHMGSAATADSRVMRAVVRVLSQRGLFLLDSRTTEASVARRVAEEGSVPAVSRRVFLDSVVSESAVARSFQQLLRTARTEGPAIAIGHPHRATMDVLERELPRLAEERVKLVPVSTLVRK